jgi:hypothetical protein
MDKPLPEDLTPNGESISLKHFTQFGSGKTPHLAEVGRDSIAALEPT